MANLCSNNIEITGDATQLAKLQEDIESEALYLEDTYFTENNYYGITYMEKSESGLTLDISSKWAPPEEDSLMISKRFPDLTITINYEEPGCDVYGLLIYQSGETTLDIAYTLEEWLLKNSDMGIELKRIESYTSEQLQEALDGLEELEDGEFYQWVPFLELALLKRSKTEELPLLVGHNWLNTDAEELYHKRCKEDC